MAQYPDAIQRVIDHLSKLPGIGHKTAERFAFFLLGQPPALAQSMAQALAGLHGGTTRCRRCFTYAQTDPCPICANPRRNPTVVCVVASPQDLQALEKTNAYEGLYHVLGGTLDPLSGVSPDQLTIKQLVERVKADRVVEVIFALNPDIPGETTMLYLSNLLKPLKVSLTRLARGLPSGSDVEYADEVTLSNAIKGRQKI